MTPLDRKLLRDLWQMKGQATAIALVIAVGVLLLVMMDGLILSLDETKRTYYERYRLADVFASVKRAPQRLLSEIEHIDGVLSVEGRVTGSALIHLPSVATPLSAQAVSLPDQGTPRLNDVYLVSGRQLDVGHEDEILLLEGFAKAHGLQLGDRLSATMNGARRVFSIVGFAQSPEFLYSAPPSEFVPDDARFAVIWMSEKALAAAYDLKGAFNEALLSLSIGSNERFIFDQVDRLLEPYGGIGAYGLADHISNRFIKDEIDGLKASNRIVPPIFLAVAAFLLNIVVSRMIQSERQQIGLLKAFGYSNKDVGLHYFKFILIVALSGAMLGCVLGVLSGRSLAVVYQMYYKFPFLVFQVDPAALVVGVLTSVMAASLGGLFVLRHVFDLTPAVAMRAPVPADFSRSLGISNVLKAFLDQPSRMVVRRLVRQPWRASGAIFGIAAGMALSASMLNVMSAFDRTLELNFTVVDRSDAMISFVHPLSNTSLYELKRNEGVIDVEPYRYVSAVFYSGLFHYRGAISGLPAEPQLNRAMDVNGVALSLPKSGVVIGSGLADLLHVSIGDQLTIDIREGRRPIIDVPVVGIADTLIGSPVYMDISALNAILNEPDRVSGAYLRLDKSQEQLIYSHIKAMPKIAGMSIKSEAREAFQKMLDSSAGATRYVMAAIAAVITFGIVYNSARIAFAERARDLASLRVMGFTKSEVSFVLLAELVLLTLFALPLGAGLGYYLSFAISQGFSTDLYQIPTVFVPESYGSAALAVLVATLFSGWVVKRDLDNIDLVSALKIRE